MKNSEKQSIIDLATSLGYEVQTIQDGCGFDGGAVMANPDGSFTRTESTSFVFTKKTVYSKSEARPAVDE